MRLKKEYKRASVKVHALRSLAKAAKPSSNTALIVSAIASITSIATVALNFWLIESVRNDLAKQTVEISKQTLELDKVKTDLASAAQRTADTNALTNQAQLALLVRTTGNSEEAERLKRLLQERNTRTGEAGLTQDFTKLISDLRPSLTVNCTYDREQSNQIVAECSFQNYGAFLTYIKRISLEAFDVRGVKALPTAIGALTGDDSNVIPAKGKGSNSYYFTLSDEAIKNGALLRFRFAADTDKQAIALTKKISMGLLTDQDLKGVTNQIYALNLVVK